MVRAQDGVWAKVNTLWDSVWPRFMPLLFAYEVLSSRKGMPCPALGTGFTGPRPTRPASFDWLLQVPVVLRRCRLAEVGGKGRVSGTVGRAGTRMCVVAAAEELVSGAQRPMDEEDAAAPVCSHEQDG